METYEQAKLIDKFLNYIYDSSTPINLAQGIDQQEIWRAENKEDYKSLEYIIEDLGLVQLIDGRSNSTLDGQCEYIISRKGRELVEKKISSLVLIERKSFADIFPQKSDSNSEIIYNSGNMIFNKNSTVGESNIKISSEKDKESFWTKANVIIAAIVGAITILGIIYTIVN